MLSFGVVDETVGSTLVCGEVSLLDEVLRAERLCAESWSRFPLSPGVCGGSSMLCACNAFSSCESRARKACVDFAGVLVHTSAKLLARVLVSCEILMHTFACRRLRCRRNHACSVDNASKVSRRYTESFRGQQSNMHENVRR